MFLKTHIWLDQNTVLYKSNNLHDGNEIFFVSLMEPGLMMIKGGYSDTFRINLGSIWYYLEPSEAPHLKNKKRIENFF